MITIAMILLGIGGAATWLLCALVPLGWQDEDGFHHGEPDERDNPP